MPRKQSRVYKHNDSLGIMSLFVNETNRKYSKR